ncbi:unnamed protein product [Rhizophagus irregularis]|uniref:Serine-threonine/tyrosine-protein kinase catalytic domain-containing protein n=1 Tax=Rhizophagus irregularis TaxID=588596 RepID=A0A915ZNP8_9GLOM|nr:unnamed protein product [Rhizophagus irregularis]
MGKRYLYNSQNVTNEFINKVESYLTDEKYYGVSQNPNTRDYILVFNNEYFDNYCGKCENINDTLLSKVAASIMESYGISQNPNTKEFILVLQPKNYCENCVALKCLHGSQNLINEFIDKVKTYPNRMQLEDDLLTTVLMMRCWDGNPDNRPNSIEIKEMIKLFYNSLDQEFKKKEHQHYEIEEQFKETQESRKESLLSIKDDKSTTHAQAIYSSRLLNPFTKNISSSSTVEITDFKIL